MSTTQTPTDTPKKRSKKPSKSKKTNGANGAPQGDGVIPFPERQDGAAEAGEATVEEYEPKEPTEKELGLADEIFVQLDSDRTLEDQAVIDGLIRLVDVHKQFLTPELFGSRDNDDEIWQGASVVGEIARLLCRCNKIEAPYRLVGFWFKDHEKWTSAGQTVEAQVKRYDAFHQHINDGQVAALIVNYHHWKTLNPRQKVFVVYHALRELDPKGKTLAPDWVGYFDEPGLFGAGVHREMVTMSRAFVKDAPDHKDAPYQLSILDEVYD